MRNKGGGGFYGKERKRDIRGEWENKEAEGWGYHRGMIEEIYD
jgi:hypothetical protein